MAGHAQDVDVFAIGMQVAGQDAGLIRRFEHHGASAVAKQHAGAAVVPVQDAAENLGADHQRPFGGSVGNHGVGHGQRIHKAAAHGLKIKHGAARHAQLVLNDGGGGRKHHVRGGRGHDDQIDVARLDTGRFHRGARGRHGQVTGGHIGAGQMAGADAGALDDPLIGRLDAARGQFLHQLVVADAAWRQVAAGTGNAGIASAHVSG